MNDAPVLSVRDGVVLRPVTVEDAAPIYELVEANRAHLAEWLPWVPFVTSEFDQRAWIGEAQERYASGTGFELVLVADEQLIGVAGFNSVSRRDAHAEIGYWLAQSHTGHGYMTDACRALLRWAFGDLDLHRVMVRAASKNRASIAVIERIGASFEGVQREAQRLNGRFVDLAVFSVLRHEWNADQE